MTMLCVLCCPDLSAQRRTPSKSADEAFERKQYNLALERYKKAYKKTSKKKYEDERAYISYQLGECYRLTEMPKSAAAQYKRVVKTEFPKEHPEVYLHYGYVLQQQEKYEDALNCFNTYAELAPDDPRAAKALEAMQHTEEWLNAPSKYEVTLLKEVNSKASDFGATWTTNNYNEIIFTTTREGVTGREKDAITGQHFADFFTARQDKNGKWDEPTISDENEIINTAGSEGMPFINASFNKMYFTRCPNHKKRQSGCQIMVASKSGSSWGEPTPVTIAGVDSLEIVGHPTLTKDEKIMYFATERHGGFGGKDIWVATRENATGDFKRPFNLGPVINTAGDEMFPFLRNDSTLYFASNGHGGLGGLDIFVSTVDTAGNWGEPVNLKAPINSTGNDFAIMFHPTEERGFFASNRNARNGLDDNIYYFIEPPVYFTLSGVIKDVNSLQFVEGANVRIVGSDNSNNMTRSSETGAFLFNNSQMSRNTVYVLTIEKKNYFTLTDTISTVGLEENFDFEKSYEISRIPNEPVVLPDILFDLAKWDLKPQFEDSLQGLIETLEVTPNITIELGSHTDNRDTEENNDILSQKRAQSVVDYLVLRGIDPLRLTAKGYGERKPRTLKRDYSVDGVTLAAGTTLTEEYINSLTSDKAKELAHQLNRRTEFRIISKDYIPRTNISDEQTAAIQMLPDDNSIMVAQDKNGNLSFKAVINGYTETINYIKDENFGVSQRQAMEMLKDGTITKDNFIGDNIDRIITTGAIADRAEFVLEEMHIANRTVENVHVTVYNNQKVDWVIGQKTLKQFGNFEIDTKSNKLTFK